MTAEPETKGRRSQEELVAIIGRIRSNKDLARVLRAIPAKSRLQSYREMLPHLSFTPMGYRLLMLMN